MADKLKDAVISVLGNKYVQNIRAFSMWGQTISSTDYMTARRLITDGKKFVAYGASLGTTGKYNPVDNTMYLPFEQPFDMYCEALIVHEATHMICDHRSLSGMTRGHSECLAHVAQAFYARQIVNICPFSENYQKRAWKVAEDLASDTGSFMRYFHETRDKDLLAVIGQKYQVSVNCGYNG